MFIKDHTDFRQWYSNLIWNEVPFEIEKKMVKQMNVELNCGKYETNKRRENFVPIHLLVQEPLQLLRFLLQKTFEGF